VARRGDTLELAVLGLLHESPMHGYELRKQLNVVLGWGRLLSYGSLYPALKRMLRTGWIAEQPPEASSGTTGAGSVGVSRRQRIVYELTGAGNARFTELMGQAGPAAWEDDNFDVRFAFFSRTDMEIRLRILEGRRTRLEERLERVQAQLARTQKEMDRYATELQRHGVESVEREVRWLSDMIAAERTAGHERTAGLKSPLDDNKPTENA
jgi:DNA-binding PadR family transcriptional regulator